MKYCEYNQITKIMENFEWSKVQKVMEHLNWCWYNDDKPPNINQIKEFAYKQMKTAFQDCGSNKRYTVACGGFEAVVLNEDEHKSIELKFVVSEYDTHYYFESWD